jgi:hypothetical protein
MSDPKTCFDNILALYLSNEYVDVTIENFINHKDYDKVLMFCFTQMLYEYQIKLTHEQIVSMLSVLRGDQIETINKKYESGETFF